MPYDYSLDERRVEGKVTSSIERGQTLRPAYQRILQKEINATSGPVMDLRAVDERRTPQDLLSFTTWSAARSSATCPAARCATGRPASARYAAYECRIEASGLPLARGKEVAAV